MIPVFRPLLPTAGDLHGFLAEMDSTRWYTNYGPLVRRFETELAVTFGVDDDTLVTCNNATLGLTQTLRALCGSDGGYCITPSWTFVASPAAILAAGLTPYFADVALSDWSLDPIETAALVDRLRAGGRRVAAVTPVAPFGGSIDLYAWAAFRARTGVAVVIDAAAGFDLYSSGAATACVPAVISLHATKAFGIGEGGVILCGEPELAKMVRAWGNFGFYEARLASLAGFNTKMTEISAAVGLATLRQWPRIRQGWNELGDAFRRRASQCAFLSPVPVMSPDWASSYGLVRFADPAVDLGAVMRSLSLAGVETRRWWEEGCHLQPAYAQCEREPLPHTERLARTVLGLPFWRGLTGEDMDRVFEALASATGGA